MRSGLTSGVAAIALALTLAGCDQIKQMTGMDQSGTNTSAGNTSTASGSPAPTAPAGTTPAKPGGSNPALEAEMQQAAAQLGSQLPMRVDQMTTVTGIRAEGTEFVYEMTLNQEIPAAQLDAVGRAVQLSNQTNLCANPMLSAFLRRGGSMNHRYTDPAGHRFETRVVSCPGG